LIIIVFALIEVSYNCELNGDKKFCGCLKVWNRGLYDDDDDDDDDDVTVVVVVIS